MEGFKIRDQHLPYFFTATVVDWVDVFTRKIYKDCVIESFEFKEFYKIQRLLKYDCGFEVGRLRRAKS